MKKFLDKVVYKVRVIAAIASLGDGLLHKVHIAARLLVTTRRIPLHMRIRANMVSVNLSVRSHEELMLVHEIFYRKTYDFSGLQEAGVIVDCGANCGISTLFLWSLFPKARIFAVEPNPKLFTRLREMVAPYSNICAIQCAIGATDGTTEFYVSPYSTVASSLLRRTSDDISYSVPVKKMETLLREQGIEVVDVLKFDVEGAEQALFSSVSVQRGIRFATGEVHEDLMSMPLAEFLSLLGQTYVCTIRPTSKKKRYICTLQTKHTPS